MQLYDLEMPNFHSMTWVSKEAKEVYGEKIKKAQAASEAIQHLSVGFNKRACGLIRLHPQHLEEEMEKYASFGLIATVIDRIYHDPTSGYPERYQRIQQNKPWRLLTVITRDIRDTNSFLHAYKSEDYGVMGELLGYPSCCVKSYFTNLDQGYHDPMWQIACATNKEEVDFHFEQGQTIRLKESTPYGVSPLLRYLRIQLLQHIPCSFSCEPSIEKAKEYEEVLETLGVEGREELKELLSMPIEWNAAKGISYVSAPPFKFTTPSVACTTPHIVQKSGDVWPEEVKIPHGLKFPWILPKRLTAKK